MKKSIAQQLSDTVSSIFENTIYYESLNPKQKKEVDTWTKGDNSFSDSAMNHSDRVTIPLEHPNQAKAPSDLESHLNNHDYKIDNYVKGTATDKYNRPTTIGKALTKTKAPPELLHRFNTDKSRQSSQNNNLRVTISRHPHDVAGMSTNTGWKSCMTMTGDQSDGHTGTMQHKLKDDIKHGTHVAYLHDKDDTNLDHPIARIALKPYENKENDKVLRPEAKEYGHGGDAFSHTVRKWSEDKFPLQDEKVYRKHNEVYDDDHSGIVFNNSKKTVDTLIDDKSPEVRKTIAANPHLSTSHVDKLVSDKNEGVRKELANNPSLSGSHIDKLIDDKSTGIRASIAKRPDLKSHHIDRLLGDESRLVKGAIAEHPKLSTDNIEKLKNDDDPVVRERLATNPKLTSDHLHSMSNDTDEGVLKSVAKHPNLSHHTIDKFLTNGNDSIKRSMAKNPNLSSHYIDKLADDPDEFVRTILTSHPKLSKHNIHKLSNDDSYIVKDYMANRLSKGQRGE